MSSEVYNLQIALGDLIKIQNVKTFYQPSYILNNPIQYNLTRKSYIHMFFEQWSIVNTSNIAVISWLKQIIFEIATSNNVIHPK